MIKFVIIFLIVFLNYKNVLSRNIGETEITTEDGIEVFQEEVRDVVEKGLKEDPKRRQYAAVEIEKSIVQKA